MSFMFEILHTDDFYVVGLTVKRVNITWALTTEVIG